MHSGVQSKYFKAMNIYGMSSMPPAVNKEKKALTRKYASGTKQEHLFYITFSYHRQFDHTQKKLRTLNERKKLA